MSRYLVFHYARPDRNYDRWELVAADDATIGDRRDGPFGVLWLVELDEQDTTFRYRLQQSGSTKDQPPTDPAGGEPQEVPLRRERTEVLYPSGYKKGKTAFTLEITSPDDEHQAIRERLEHVLDRVVAVHDAITTVQSSVTGLDDKTDRLGNAAVATVNRLATLDTKTDRLSNAATAIFGKLTAVESKTDDLGDAATLIDNRLATLDTKTDHLGNDTIAIFEKVSTVDTNTGTIHDATVVIHDNVDKLLARGGVIDIMPQPHPPDDVERLVNQAQPAVDAAVAALDRARKAFASELGVPAVPAVPPPPTPDSRGRAAQEIIECLSYAELAAQVQDDRLQKLAGDAAAMAAQDLVALRAELLTTVDQVDGELSKVERLTQSDDADRKLRRALRDEVLPELYKLRVLAAGVSP